MWNPAIPYWRTGRKFGEHGEFEEHEKLGKDGKYQSDESIKTFGKILVHAKDPRILGS